MINTEDFPITIDRRLADGSLEKLWIKPGYVVTIEFREVLPK